MGIYQAAVYVHIDPETLRRHPWVGVLIGGAGCLLMLLLVSAFWRQQRALGVGPPTEVALEEAALPAGVQSRWVVLRGGRWLCDQALEEARRPPESWLFGRVSNTQVPVLDAGGALRVVVKHDEEWPAAECARAAQGLAGVLTRTDDRVWGSAVSPSLRTWPRRGELLVLHPGQGPAAARRYALMGAGFLAAFSVFAGYYAVLWSRQREMRVGGP